MFFLGYIICLPTPPLFCQSESGGIGKDAVLGRMRYWGVDCIILITSPWCPSFISNHLFTFLSFVLPVYRIYVKTNCQIPSFHCQQQSVSVAQCRIVFLDLVVCWFGPWCMLLGSSLCAISSSLRVGEILTCPLFRVQRVHLLIFFSFNVFLDFVVCGVCLSCVLVPMRVRIVARFCGLAVLYLSGSSVSVEFSKLSISHNCTQCQVVKCNFRYIFLV